MDCTGVPVKADLANRSTRKTTAPTNEARPFQKLTQHFAALDFDDLESTRGYLALPRKK